MPPTGHRVSEVRGVRDLDGLGGSGGVVVRPARPDELRRAGEISVEAYAADGRLSPDDPYAERLADAPGRAADAELLVAVDADGMVLGTVTVCLPGTPWAEVSRPGEIEFRMLAVDPAARGRGIGTTLVQAVLRRGRELGVDRVVLCSAEHMDTAQRLYGRLGFERLPERDWSPAEDHLLKAYAVDLQAVRADAADA